MSTESTFAAAQEGRPTGPLVQGYEVVIGFETHAQLSTVSKIFSRAPTAFGAEANTQAAPVDLALPGTLPVMNKGAVERAIELGLALGSHIAPRSVFARKNYFYPDLPKGYQISQFEIPVVQGGSVEFFLETGKGADAAREKKTVRLVRAHLEEDAGKSLHENFVGQSGIDLNRAGTPLLEIVTEPDIRSSAEAVAYARELHKIVTWIGICDGNMQEGSFRCDANVSVRKPGQPLGTRREIKNLNSFKFMQQAIDYEIRWQIEEIEDGRAIQQATVLFNPDTGETRAMRTKEDAADYRYFPDPDLPPLVISDAWIEEVRAQMLKPPREVAADYQRNYGLSAYLSDQLTSTNAKSSYFEKASIWNSDTGIPANVIREPSFVRRVATWVAGELSRKINDENAGDWNAEKWHVMPDVLGRIAFREHDNTISSKVAKELFNSFWTATKQSGMGVHPDDVDAVIEAKGLRQDNDSGALEAILDEVLAANPKNVEEFRAGKEKAFNALVGQAMKASKGKANPAQVNALLRQKLQD
ncbi:Asp-tRNA(Asn)/Glu-tRNA(Gln) amidotransferase subunit GatB [Xylophilus ampelinus]|uniref:Aspartyl/glutamyl-tRNA(Asn/Gln) amidotransferase subunit B n=1 Tax=Xylophilus ampelinus TaxID=54067 RepID=A0A318SH06_9BURK|nr:Asp-tRNA(Asn)/Glu-tRNA(Gln) amidotransferase subunit GatB [Xylophilus ampelinus]MCS4510734.1 Asp-tRNA(Asn)/Glu-tRNA(Gln) amidotransferase subunit GatB [Xylophilus ampelinus]PYE76290.1 aspartyl/glutamyl-tRNA(Asn/Gln) amidotransferase subunit B [Xylophilus ampelinus]